MTHPSPSGPYSLRPLAALLALLWMFATASPAWAQVTVKPDGALRAVVGFGASLSSGNRAADSFSLTAEAVRATDDDKWTFGAKAQRANSQGVKTAELLRGGVRYDRNLEGAATFWFAGLDLERNTFANLNLRSQASGGMGLHVIKSGEHTLDLFGGASYTTERYVNSTPQGGDPRKSNGLAGLFLGEESTHKLGASTEFKQRLSFVPNLTHERDYRLNWDANLAVAMSRRTHLTVGLSVVRDGDPAPGRKATDTLLTTGVSVRFE
jgi:putative salt-induced outer membrane protein